MVCVSLHQHCFFHSLGGVYLCFEWLLMLMFMKLDYVVYLYCVFEHVYILYSVQYTHNIHIIYTVQCTMYIYSLHSSQCMVFNVQCILYCKCTVNIILLIILCTFKLTLYSLHLYCVHSTLYTIQCTQCIVYNVQCTQCTLYIVHISLMTNLI